MWQFIVQLIAQKKAQNQAFITDAQKAASAQQAGATAEPTVKPGQLAGAKDNVSGALGSMMGGSAPGGSSPSAGGGMGADIEGVQPDASPQPSQQIDVFGGEQFGEAADTAGVKAAENPAVADYLQNAMGNYARKKIGKRIGGKLDSAADVANAYGEEGKTAAGAKIQGMADWFYGSDRKKRDEARRFLMK